MQSVFKEITGDFERASGHKLTIHYGTIGAINQWIIGGEEADFVIGSSLSMPALVKLGKMNSASVAPICKTAIGIVVPSGSTKPSIVSVEDFRRALLTAKAIVYADPVRGGAAGIHVASVIEKLGLTEQLKPKIKLAAGGDITEVTLALGNGALGMTQVSEMAGKPGADVVGPLPEELQNYTVFVGGIPSGAREPEAVAAFVNFLKSPTAIAVIKAKGMQVD
jgi:molybdate transport system substrate-binding protein